MEGDQSFKKQQERVQISAQMREIRIKIGFLEDKMKEKVAPEQAQINELNSQLFELQQKLQS